MTSSAPYSVQCAHGVTVVRLMDERFHFDSADRVFGEIKAMLERDKPPFVIVNMHKVQYLHSAALGELVDLRRCVSQYGGVLRFCSLQPQARETLQITRIDRLITICESEQAAMAA